MRKREPQLAEIQCQMAADSTLETFMQVLLSGWSDQTEALAPELHPYFTVQDELTAQDGIPFKGLRCIIPATPRAMIHECLQGTHTGSEGCLRHAHETVYWLGLNADIQIYIFSRCI